jgi:hypothetical protein
MREEERHNGSYTDDAMTVQVADYQNVHLYNVLNSDDGRGLKSRGELNKTDLSIA